MAEEIKQSVSDGYKLPSADTSESELLAVSKAWDKESKEYHDKLQIIWDVNENYYKGNQTKKELIPYNMSDAVQNHIFMGVETLIPIITANNPKFIAEPQESSDVSVKYANSIAKALSILYEEVDVRTKGEMIVRHMMIYRFGAWIPFFNSETNTPDVRYVRPQRLYFPDNAKLLYFAEKKDYSSDEFIEEFGEDVYKKFLDTKGIEYNGNEMKYMHTVMEYHTSKLTFRKCESYIFGVEENDTYDFTNEEKNFFDEPKLPIILASAFRLGKEPIGETDLITQAKPIQDVINVVNRLIINNATKTGNGQWFIDPEVMSHEEAQEKITNAPGLVIVASGAANQNKMRRDAPPPMPAYIAELKIMAERAFDNIFGTHSTTRGERGQPETLGGRMLLKQADYGRIDLLVREYERVVAELGNWFVQLMKVNLNGEKTFRAYGESGSEFIKITDSTIEKGTKILIKSGTTLPTDEVSKRQEAMELWAMGAIPPEILYERLKFPNPEEAAEKLLAWKRGELELTKAAQGTPAQPRENSVRPQPTGRGKIGEAAQKLGGLKQ